MMGGILAFFGAGPARLQGLLIGAAVLLALCLGLITWALIEKTRRLELEVEVVALRDQTDVLADSLKRCNDGVEAAAKAGAASVADTKRLLGLAETAMLKTAAFRDEARAIVNKPAPVRADGTRKTCEDALAEIRAKVKP